MYSAHLSGRDRAGPVGAVVVVHLALFAMLLALSGNMPRGVAQPILKSFDVREIPPPPKLRTIPPPRKREKAIPVKAAGGAAPDRKSEATPVVVPPTKLEQPTPNFVVAALVPQAGVGPAQGTAPTPGTGDGAGGTGNGVGNGVGSGVGAGDDAGDSRPQPVFVRISPRAFPREMVEFLPRGAHVFIMFSVQVDGRVTDCTVRQSSGQSELDARVCQLAEERFRWQPARHVDGTPFVAKAAYMFQLL